MRAFSVLMTLGRAESHRGGGGEFACVTGSVQANPRVRSAITKVTKTGAADADRRALRNSLQRGEHARALTLSARNHDCMPLGAAYDLALTAHNDGYI